MKRIALIMIGLIFVTSLISASKRTANNGERFIAYQYKNPKFIFEDFKVNEFTYNEVSKACYQLPTELLSQLTTEELILYCGDHPMLALGRSLLIPDALRDFNGFQELILRDDFFNELISLLNDNLYSDLSNIESMRKYNLSISFFYTKALFEALNSFQKIEHLKFLKSLSEIKHPFNLKFSANKAYHFLLACYPEDSHDVQNCFLFGDNPLQTSGPSELLKEFLDKKIEQLMEDKD